MDDGSTPRHAPNHMPPPDATGAPQHTRDAPLRGDPVLDGNRPPVRNRPRVTPWSARWGGRGGAREGWSVGGIVMPVAVLLVVALLVALSAAVLF